MQRSATKNGVLLGILGFLLIVCIILMVVMNNHTQTEIFWANQREKLTLITQTCTSEVNAWVRQQMAMVAHLSGEYLGGRRVDRADIEAGLNRLAGENPHLLSAYIILGNTLSYFSGVDPITAHSFTSDDWYLDAKNAGGAIIFSEPYLEPISGELVVSCLKSFKARSGITGIVGVDISLEELNAQVSALHPSQNGGVYLASAKGKVMTYAADSAFMPKIVDGQAVFLSAQAVLSQVRVLQTFDRFLPLGIQMERIYDYDGKEKYEAVTFLPQTGWMLGVNIPISDYAEAVAEVISHQLPLILLAVLMSLLSIGAAFLMIASARRTQTLRRSAEMAQVASKTKSDFLSRMSHEMRTPMNAIIGMAKIAEGTEDLEKVRHCLSTIDSASDQLLGIINDVLDMSKIEAGKFELDSAPFNLEKMLMKLCNLILDKTEAKGQKLSVVFGPSMGVHYVGDELRLSQVITNLLSNAVKFTPEGGAITLTVSEVQREQDHSLLRFQLQDTGIGISPEQIGRLFQSFEQADGSISRRFGGTGLGLVICKGIVEKMGGRIWVESELGKGSSFFFEAKLARSPETSGAALFDGIKPSDLRLLLVDEDRLTRERIRAVTDSFGMVSDEADGGRQALQKVAEAAEKRRPYDVILLDYDMRDLNGLDTAKQMDGLIDKNTVVIVTSFLGWNKIEAEAKAAGIFRYLPKPLFPSSILDSITDVVGHTVKALDMKAAKAPRTPDFSHVHILLAEDIEINREILQTLLEATHVQIDTAENGLLAVQKFRLNPDKYDMIIMDLQMPEMDGHQATRAIRQMDLPKAKAIPIVAMTANVFKEDIDQCMEDGMNDHLPKPINAETLMEKIEFYTGGEK